MSRLAWASGYSRKLGRGADPHLVVAGRDVHVVGAGALDEQVPRPAGDDHGERAVGPADGLDRQQVGVSRVVAGRLVVSDPARRPRACPPGPRSPGRARPRRAGASTRRTAARPPWASSMSRQAWRYGSPSARIDADPVLGRPARRRPARGPGRRSGHGRPSPPEVAASDGLDGDDRAGRRLAVVGMHDVDLHRLAGRSVIVDPGRGCPSPWAPAWNENAWCGVPRVLDLVGRRRVAAQPEHPEPAVGVGRRGRRPEARPPLRVVGLELVLEVQPRDADDDPRGGLALDVDQPALDGLLGRQGDRRLLPLGVGLEVDRREGPPGRGGDQAQVIQAARGGSPGRPA